MDVSVEWREGKWPTFKVILRAKPGADPFLEIKDCKLVDGSKGTFVSYPARKDEKSGKWWPYLYGGEAFNAHVVKLAQAALPGTARGVSRKESSDDEIPF